MKIAKLFWDNGFLAAIFWLDDSGKMMRKEFYYANGKTFRDDEGINVRMLDNDTLRVEDKDGYADWRLSRNGLMEEGLERVDYCK